MQIIYRAVFNSLFRLTGSIPNSIRNILLFLCCASLIFMYFFYTGDLASINLEMFCSAVLALTAIFSINGDMEYVKWNRWVYYPMFSFGIGMIIVELLHPIGDGFTSFALDLTIIFPALYYIWINRGDFETLYNILSIAVIAAGFISFIYCIILSIGGDLIIIDGHVAGYKSNPNLLGTVGVPVIIAGLYLLSEHHKNMMISALASIGVGIGISYVIISASRTSFLAAIICVSAYMIFEIRSNKHDRHLRKIRLSTLAVIILLLASTLIMGMNLENINNKVINDRSVTTEENVDNENKSGTPGFVNKFIYKHDSVDRYSSGRLTIWNIYLRNTTFLGRPHSYIEEELEKAVETRAHNNIIEYLYRCGIIVGSLYVIFFIAVIVFGLRILFCGNTKKKYGLFVVMDVGVYSVFAMLEIAYLPFIRIIPCIFFLSISPLLARDHLR